ncbi:catenin (cadherin-associated protein), alpha 3 [Plakobranchus ocellatus]|uniref:Catenin (Cadherin-associated protein), alpha 3 n=1 Tax=Plakobranchus ocellatus TaxID=259542 RepID=A0AAV4C984_9GAST|nr:catenin (cadherin-associated protein), alpha 3 [Plakobranchus ocellatus]
MGDFKAKVGTDKVDDIVGKHRLGIRNERGIKVGGQNINNLRYADDTVLIAENKEDLQKLLNIVEEESRKKGLELNSKKTEVMVITNQPQTRIPKM